MPKPAGRTSVMADRARGEVEGDDARAALHRRLEFYPTPPWAARAGGELIQRLDPGPWTCWEPACGEGHMVHGLRDYFSRVSTSDVHAHGPAVDQMFDFLGDDEGLADDADWIATNPPFAKAADFVRVGLRRARRGVAILARLSFLESAGRYPLFFGDQRLTAFAPFFERVPMTLGRWDPQASTATAYAWFVWMVHAPWSGARVIPIPPGTRERLTRPDDAALFAAKAPLPLLETDRP